MVGNKTIVIGLWICPGQAAVEGLLETGEFAQQTVVPRISVAAGLSQEAIELEFQFRFGWQRNVRVMEQTGLLQASLSNQ